MNSWDYLVFLSGSALGGFIMGMAIYIRHLGQVEDLRNFHASQLEAREDRAYARGYADRSFMSRNNTPRL